MEEIKQGMNIIVDEGSVKVPICNKFGDEIGVLYFNPTDIGMIGRFNEVMADFDKIVEPLESVNIERDGTVDESNEVEFSAMNLAQSRLYEACDYIFGGNMSEAFFGKVHPFSPVNGRFYCENALEAVGDFISEQFERETNKISSRTSKYTHGYEARTGKHKDGKK